MEDLDRWVGASTLAAHFGASPSTVRRWSDRHADEGFPRPRMRPEGLCWHLGSVDRWVRENAHWLGLLIRGKGSNTDIERGGQLPDQWPTGRISTYAVGTLLGLPRGGYAYDLARTKGFPQKGGDGSFDAQEVLRWAQDNRHRKGLRWWVGSTWADLLTPTPDAGAGEVDLEGVARYLGVSLNSAKWYAHQDPSFPDPLRLGIWKLDDVDYWHMSECTQEVRDRLNETTSGPRY